MSRYKVLLAWSTSLLFVLVAYLVVLAGAQPAYAAEGPRLLTTSGVQQGGLSTQSEGEALFLGSPDGKTYNAKVSILGVTSGSARYYEENDGEDITIFLDGISAETILVSLPENSFKSFTVWYSGDNYLSDGISVLDTITESCMIGAGEAGSTLRIGDGGISVQGPSYSKDIPDLTFFGGNVSIVGGSVNALRFNIIMQVGTLEVTDSDWAIAINATGNSLGGYYYGGQIIVGSGFELTCTVLDPAQSFAISAVYMQNDPASLKSIRGRLSSGASFNAGGRVYEVSYSNGAWQATPTDGYKGSQSITYGGVKYLNPLYASSQQAKKGVATGKTAKYKGMSYKVLNNSKNTVALYKADKNKTAVVIPASVVLNGKRYSVAGISKNAFKTTKVKTVTVKTKKLTKKSVAKCFSGTKKVKTVKVSVGSKKANKTYVARYKKIFTKKNCGLKVVVK